MKIFYVLLFIFIHNIANASWESIKKSENSDKLIVFVHGLGGDRKTWKNSNQACGNFDFPKGLASDTSLNMFDIGIFSYDSVCKNQTLSELAKHLNQAIKNTGKKYQSINFIAHSFGGLVVRKALIYNYQAGTVGYKANKVFLLGTPNFGENLSSLISLYCGGERINDLRSGRGTAIDALNDDWRSLFLSWRKNPDFEVIAFAENRKEDFGIGAELKIVVEKDSASAFSNQSLVFNMCHTELAKPCNPSDQIFLTVKSNLLDQPQVVSMSEKNDTTNRVDTFLEVTKSIIPSNSHKLLEKNIGKRVYSSSIFNTSNLSQYDLFYKSLVSEMNFKNELALKSYADFYKTKTSSDISKEHQSLINAVPAIRFKDNKR